MDTIWIPGTEALSQPSIGSIYDEMGTADSGYDESGPFHCEDCIHKTAMDEPFCVHPKVVGDHDLQNRLVQINGRPVIKIDLEHGCCAYVRQAPEKDEDEDHDE